MGNDREVTDRVFNSLVPSFSQRNSGYTRIVLLPRRKGDGAEMVRLEWVDEVVKKNEDIPTKAKGN